MSAFFAGENNPFSDSSDKSPKLFSPDLEYATAVYLFKMYRKNPSTADVIALMQDLKTSAHNQDVFACMIHNLFGERLSPSIMRKLRLYINYQCNLCSRLCCKLWRKADTSCEKQTLQCQECIRPAVIVDANGRYKSKVTGALTDHVEARDGLRVPAVPTDDSADFWDLASIPENRMAWWRSLKN